MKILLLSLLLVGANAFAAGAAKLTWNCDGSATDGSHVPITQFTVYWGLNGAPLTNAIQMGPPAPLPWKMVGIMGTWSKTFTNPAWVPGSNICFVMSAWSGSQESAHTNQVCKTFSTNPNEPAIIDITYP